MIAAKRAQIFLASEAGIDSQILRHPSKSGTSLSGSGGRAEDRDTSRIGDDASHNAADDGAFARAIRPQKAKAFACVQFERHACNSLHCAKALDESMHFERKR